MKKLVLATASVLALGINGANAAEAPATGKAHATVLAPTTIEETVSMQFGNMLKGNHTVELNTSDSRSGEAAYLVGGITEKSGEFAIEGTPNQAITITSPAEFTVSNDKGSSMKVDQVKMKLNGGDDKAGGTDFSGNIGDDGKATLKVGGTLNVTEAASEGTYQGTYNVKVSY